MRFVISTTTMMMMIMISTDHRVSYESSHNTPMQTTVTKQVILIGEVKIGDGVVHQRDLVRVLDGERITQWPKNMEDVGRALRSRTRPYQRSCNSSCATIGRCTARSYRRSFTGTCSAGERQRWAA